MQRSRQPRRSAFTLIELLVVIAIIAILAAILFPVFAQAREKARQAACMSNQKQIGLALMQYQQDYDETFPLRYGSGSAADFENGCQRTWKNMLMPYIKTMGVFRCPSNPSAELLDERGCFPAGYAMWLPDAGAARLVGHGAEYPQPMAGIERPASSLIIVETSWRYADGGPYLGYQEPARTHPWVTPGSPLDWNSGHAKKKGNLIFMDGHVKYVALKDTFKEEGTPALNQWRFNAAEVNANGGGYLLTLRNNLNSYPAND